MADWQKIEEGVAAAAELEPIQHEAFLDEFCNGDDELRSEIVSLLKYESAAGSFLEGPVGPYASVLTGDTDNDLPGKELGHYRMIREIGRGGMGSVHLASRSDDQYQKQVAIKILRRGMDTEDIIRRFRHERQILAGLDHPQIARLLDGGTTSDGLPYLVMEYIEGEPIDEYCERRQLGINERLTLFLSVCDAVNYAHQNLVVHRDIKPSNILVTADGSAKLLDFGIAKVLDGESSGLTVKQTATAMRLMTPDYASPEQIRGERITTASDVYSLGVVLFELLTAHRPYRVDSKAQHELLKAICDDEPTKPSAVTDVNPVPRSYGRTGDGKDTQRDLVPLKLLRGDLDTIILTALRKEPERRYQSVENLSADIERHLKRLPISARPNTYKYLAEKFIRRNPYVVAMTGLVFILLIIGVGAVLWQARKAEQQRVRAEKRFDEVRKLSNSLMFEIHDSVQNLEGSTPTRELIVSRALEYLDSLAQESEDDYGLQTELATAYQKVGDIQGNPYSANLGDTPGARESYQKAVSILERVNSSHPDTDSQISLGKGYRAVGDVMQAEGDVDGCVESYRRSLHIFEALAEQNPDRADVRDELARAYETLGDGLGKIEDSSDEIRTSFQKCVALREGLAGQNPADAKIRRSLAISYLKLGGALDSSAPEAVEALKKAIVILEDLSARDQTNARARREVGFAYFQLGNVLQDAELFKPALEARQKAFLIRQQIAADDPKNKQAQFDLGIAYQSLSETYRCTGDTAQALASARLEQDILEKLSSEDPENAVYRRNTGISYEEAALAFEAVARSEGTSKAERIKNWKEARTRFQKARQKFIELKERNELQPRDEPKIPYYDQKIAEGEQ